MKIIIKIVNVIVRNLWNRFTGFEISRQIYRSKFVKQLSVYNRIKLELKTRYQPGSVLLFRKKFEYADSASFLFIFNEIFEKEIYRFKTLNPGPVIIDCGANIGLGALYFKFLFPDSEILAFEPNPLIFSILKKNIETFDLKKVSIFEKAVWNYDGNIDFYLENADGSRINQYKGKEIKIVPCVSLNPFLERKIDFLKIDIEGAETIVLDDCSENLHHVHYLFIEFHSFANQKQELDHLLGILSSKNFRYYITHIGVFSTYPFVSRKIDSDMDNQLNIYCINEDFEKTHGHA